MKGSIDDLYQWKYGKRALRCYNDPCFRDQDDGQTFEEFKLKEVNYRAFISLSEMKMRLGLDKTKKDKLQGDNSELYVSNIDTILNRYVYNGKSVFLKVEDLNDFQDYPGVYILCFDYEQKIYVGQTKKSLKKRILQHFISPQSDFDKSHSLEEVSNIYILNIPEYYIDDVEQDCIASISTKLLFNIFAGGDSIEQIKSNRYVPQQHMLDDKSIALVSEQAYTLNSLMFEIRSET